LASGNPSGVYVAPGGSVDMNVWCQDEEAQELVKQFQIAGFSDVKTTGSGVGTMLTAKR